MKANIFNNEELTEASTSDVVGLGSEGNDNPENIRLNSSIVVAESGESLGASSWKKAGAAIFQVNDFGKAQSSTGENITAKAIDKSTDGSCLQHTKQPRDEILRGLGATASFNNLLLSARITGRPIGDLDVIEAMHRMGPREIDQVMIEEDQLLGSYSFKRIANTLNYVDIRVHIRVLCFLINHLNAQWRYEGKYLRLVRFARNKKGLTAKVLDARKEGLFILFGYTRPDEECFVSYNAETAEIFNGNTGMVHNLCNEALEEIFPAGLQTIHELIVLEQISVKIFRLQKRFSSPQFEDIPRQTFNFLKDGEHGTELIW